VRPPLFLSSSFFMSLCARQKWRQGTRTRAAAFRFIPRFPIRYIGGALLIVLDMRTPGTRRS